MPKITKVTSSRLQLAAAHYRDAKNPGFQNARFDSGKSGT
jgi:hypothetical protein